MSGEEHAQDHGWVGATAIVTGASRGIGRRIAEGLAARGLNLIVTARSEDTLKKVQADCAALGASVQIVGADISTPEGRDRLVEQAGEFDVLINNAGIEIAVGLEGQSQAHIEAQIATNLTAPIELTRRFLPTLKQRPKAAIVNISSMSGKSPTPYNAVYAATKHGLNGFTSSLRIELEQTSVRAGVVCPSFVAETGMWADTGVKAPMLMREVSIDRLTKAVWQVMEGRGEVLVTPSPVRPLLALQVLFPGLSATVLKTLGVTAKLKERAQRVTELADGKHS